MSVNVLFIDVPAIQVSHLENSLKTGIPPSYPYGFPLGILYLSSYVKQQHPGTMTAMVDYPSRLSQITNFSSVDDFIATAKDSVSFEPDILAFSAIFSSCHPFLMRSVEVLKEIWPNSVSILGGMHPSNLERKMLEHKDIDYVAKGEGEVSFSQFVGAFRGKDRDNVKGIYSQKTANLNLVGDLPLGDYVNELDDIPFPDWDLLDMDYFVSEGARSQIRIGKTTLDKKTAIIMTTRGCPFQCTFCSSHSVHGRKMRYRSVKNVIEEVKILNSKYGVTRFVPEDDLFTGNKNKVISLLEAFRKLNIPGFEIQFPNALSPMVLHDDIMNALVESGMKLANISIDSGSAYTQKHIVKRRTNLKQARHVVDYLKNKGVVVRCNFIIGFPGETVDLMQETIDFAKTLEVDWVHIGMAMPLVGSEMYKQLVDKGDIEDDERFWSICDFDRRSFDTDEISANDLMELSYKANLDINFINNPSLINGDYKRIEDVFTDIVTKYPFHIFGWYALMQAHRMKKDYVGADAILDKIVDLIKNNQQSSDLYAKYADIFPENLNSFISSG